MSTLTFDQQPHPRRPLPRRIRELAHGFFYWLAFLLVLEPDNVLRASQAGQPLGFGHEFLRITAAALLGASAMPSLLKLTRRFPVLGPGRWRHALYHAAGAAGLALGLIVMSCFLAAWGFEGKWLPSSIEIRDELVSNWLLLVYALAAFTAIAHAVHFFQRGAVPPATSMPEQRLTRIPVKSRGRLSFLDVASIDWVETQGNYLALHAGPAVHMIRETLVKFEAELDASRFVRVHRRMIVAVDRIREMRPVANGDAILLLRDGSELRASRSYREAIREKWSGPGQADGERRSGLPQSAPQR